jgi:hypothetical protein
MSVVRSGSPAARVMKSQTDWTSQTERRGLLYIVRSSIEENSDTIVTGSIFSSPEMSVNTSLLVTLIYPPIEEIFGPQ